MHGRHSLFLELEQINPEVEHFLSKIRAEKRESKKKIAGNKPHHLSNLSSISLLPFMTYLQEPIYPLLLGHLRLNNPLSKHFRQFCGLEYENPFWHIDIFLEICSIAFSNNIFDDFRHL